MIIRPYESTPYDLWLEEVSRFASGAAFYDSLDDYEYGYKRSKYIYDSRNVLLSRKEMMLLLHPVVGIGDTNLILKIHKMR